MRISTKHLEISGIRRIVINRLIVWQQDQTCDERHPVVWRKIAGGPGFNLDEAAGRRKATKIPEEMKNLVDRLLQRQVVTGKWHGHEVVNELYRVWIHGDTLNIVQRKRGAA